MNLFLTTSRLGSMYCHEICDLIIYERVQTLQMAIVVIRGLSDTYLRALNEPSTGTPSSHTAYKIRHHEQTHITHLHHPAYYLCSSSVCLSKYYHSPTFGRGNQLAGVSGTVQA